MRKIFWALGALVLLGVFGVAYYGLSPLFVNIKVDEQAPSIPQTTPQQEESVPSATVMGTAGHPASGTARLVNADDKNYVRYENFKTINGPDIYVYLSKDLEAKEYVNLGRVRATEGNINYEIPPGIDPGEYRYVLIWCKAFSVLFNYADLSTSR